MLPSMARASNFAISVKQIAILFVCIIGFALFSTFLARNNNDGLKTEQNPPKQRNPATKVWNHPQHNIDGLNEIFTTNKSQTQLTKAPRTISALDDSLEQTDEALIEYVRTHVLEPPDGKPYNLNTPSKQYVPLILDTMNLFQEIFKNKTRGVFFEAGAFDGEFVSTSLHLEQFFNWTGLLVEGNPVQLSQLRQKHRKAWLAPVYISDTKFPKKFTVSNNGQSTFAQEVGDVPRVYRCRGSGTLMHLTGKQLEEIQKRRDCHPVSNSITIQSIPLFTLLKAARITDIDFFALDVEGLEEKILETLPFEQFNIKVARIEHACLLKVDSSRIKGITDIMTRRGFKAITTFKGVKLDSYDNRDLFFVKQGLLDDKSELA